MKKKFVPAKISIPSNPSSRLRVYYSAYSNSTGKVERKNIWVSNKAFPNFEERKSEALRIADELNNSLKNGSYWKKRKNKLKLIDAFDKLSELRIVATKTAETYETKNKFFKSWLTEYSNPKINLVDFNSKMAISYINHVKKIKGSKSTINNYISHAKLTFNDFVKQEWIEINPFKKIEKLRNRKDIPAYIFENDKKLILEYLKQNDDGLYFFCLFIYYLLARPIELINIKISDINISEGIIRVKAENSKTDKSKNLTIPDVLIKIICDNIQPHNYNSNDYLFSYNLKPGGKIISRTDYISKRFRRIAKKENWNSTIKVYHFKHTGIQDYAKAGVPFEQIARQAGITMEMLSVYLEIHQDFRNRDLIAKNAPILPTLKAIKSTNHLSKLIEEIESLNEWEKDYILSKLS